MVPLHILWSVDSTKDISRRSQFLLNFDPWQLSQHTLSYVDPRDCLDGCVPVLQRSNSGVIWHISDVSGLAGDILLHEEFWPVHGVLLSAVLHSWGRHHPKCSRQQRVWSLCEKGFLAPGLLFCIFSSLPYVFVHCWWMMGQSLVVALLDEQQAPRQSQGKARERSCGSTALTVSSIRRWMTGKVRERMWIIFFSLSLILLVCFYLSWWDGRSVEAFLVIPTLWGKAMALQALKKNGKTSRYAGMRNQA